MHPYQHIQIKFYPLNFNEVKEFTLTLYDCISPDKTFDCRLNMEVGTSEEKKKSLEVEVQEVHYHHPTA